MWDTIIIMFSTGIVLIVIAAIFRIKYRRQRERQSCFSYEIELLLRSIGGFLIGAVLVYMTLTQFTDTRMLDKLRNFWFEKILELKTTPSTTDFLLRNVINQTIYYDDFKVDGKIEEYSENEDCFSLNVVSQWRVYTRNIVKDEYIFESPIFKFKNECRQVEDKSLSFNSHNSNFSMDRNKLLEFVSKDKNKIEIPITIFPKDTASIKLITEVVEPKRYGEYILLLNKPTHTLEVLLYLPEEYIAQCCFMHPGAKDSTVCNYDMNMRNGRFQAIIKGIILPHQGIRVLWHKKDLDLGPLNIQSR